MEEVQLVVLETEEVVSREESQNQKRTQILEFSASQVSAEKNKT